MRYLAKKQPELLRTAVGAAIALASLGGAGSAIAQQQEGAQQRDRELEEIVVTTQLREASEATTAISMNVLSGDFLASNDIKDIVDLQNAVPALQFFQNGSYVQANIRGVGNPSTGGPSEQVGVPVFFDGATQGEEMGIASGFFDVSDIQVLRGPQATFVGQAAAGGAILINSERPDFNGLSGFIEATAGTYGRMKVSGALNLPISDKVAGRIAYMGENRGSFYTNKSGRASTGGEQYVPGEQNENNYRLSLLWEPTENISVWTKYEYSELHQYGIPQQPNPNFYTGYRDDDGDPLTPSIPVTTYDHRDLVAERRDPRRNPGTRRRRLRSARSLGHRQSQPPGAHNGGRSRVHGAQLHVRQRDHVPFVVEQYPNGQASGRGRRQPGFHIADGLSFGPRDADLVSGIQLDFAGGSAGRMARRSLQE